MKERINLAAARSRAANGPEAGAGGIREIEFFAQAHQLIYGGKEPSLRCAGRWRRLSALARLRIVAGRSADRLAEAYDFCGAWSTGSRRTGNGRHTPSRTGMRTSGGSPAMGVDGPRPCCPRLDPTPAAVHGIYDRLFGGERRSRRTSADVQALSCRGGPPADADERLCGWGSGRRSGRRNLDRPAGRPAARRRCQRRATTWTGSPRRSSTGPPGRPTPTWRCPTWSGSSRPSGPDDVLRPAVREAEGDRRPRAFFVAAAASSPATCCGHPELLDTFLRNTCPRWSSRSRTCGRTWGRSWRVRRLRTGADHTRAVQEPGDAADRRARHGGQPLPRERDVPAVRRWRRCCSSSAVVSPRREVRRRFGTPVDAYSGEEASFCVWGWEARLKSSRTTATSTSSSLYCGRGDPAAPAGGGRLPEKSPHEYFAKVAQRMISILTTSTREGPGVSPRHAASAVGNAGPPRCRSMEAFVRYHERVRTALGAAGAAEVPVRAGDGSFGRGWRKRVKAFIFDAPCRKARRRDPPASDADGAGAGPGAEDRLNLKVGRGGVVDCWEFPCSTCSCFTGGGGRRVRSPAGRLKALTSSSGRGSSRFRIQGARRGVPVLRSLDVRPAAGRHRRLDRPVRPPRSGTGAAGTVQVETERSEGVPGAVRICRGSGSADSRRREIEGRKAPDPWLPTACTGPAGFRRSSTESIALRKLGQQVGVEPPTSSQLASRSPFFS